MFPGSAKMHSKRPCTDGVLPRPEDELVLQSRPRKIRPIIQNILLCGRPIEVQSNVPDFIDYLVIVSYLKMPINLCLENSPQCCIVKLVHC